MAKHFDFRSADEGSRADVQQPHTRSVASARELFELHVAVPWSAWEEYKVSSGHWREKLLLDVGVQLLTHCSGGELWDHVPEARRLDQSAVG